MQSEFESMEDYWQGKICDERSFYEEQVKVNESQFKDLEIRMKEYEDLLTLESAKSGDAVSKGWPDEEGYCYCFSAFAVAKMAAHAQEEADKKGRENLIINSCCPGMVATAMTDFKGCAPEEGAVTPVYLATLAADAKEPRGMFVKDKKAMPLTDLITLKPADLPWNK